jgi:hypothetical protein
MADDEKVAGEGEEKKGKHLGDIQIPKKAPEPEPEEMDLSGLGNEVWSTLAGLLSSDKDLDDVALIKKYLRNIRRSALRNLIDAKIAYNLAVADLMDLQTRDVAEGEDPKIKDQLTKVRANDVDMRAHHVKAWEHQLKALVDYAKSGDYEEIIAKFYADTNFATDNQS